ncbi:DEAD/DEAH box helicase [Devosia sp. WQ 349]|uniref:DEAD/DEAH box helicase n=1 Tax=Devosia sp. WQ 349K1 TaxID=2800329 RepID=UPI001903481A|nr:DEAD/DEAH box helicase [Devosia sp. WQ 349K1]MBK1792946.1 DEAD/DEAH box helicase [Devosia sp. WQ 349K1]
MTSQPFASNPSTTAFDSLAEPVRKWIWTQKWAQLRDVQTQAIPKILEGGDVIVSARTAAGKTEAAFLPLITRVLARGDDRPTGFDILYVAPLKALINDQHRRLEGLLEECGLPLHKWHGDVSSDAKQRARTRPSGVILITPESLEATLVRRGREVEGLFSNLSAVVIDELHAFVGRERGMQLQSILTRIEIACRRDRIDRIGLSATLGDMGMAADFLRPGRGQNVSLVEGSDAGNGLKLQVRGYAKQLAPPPEDGEAAPSARPSIVHDAIADDLFAYLRGHTNLMFAGSRQKVEAYTDALREKCEANGLPNEFFAHHGNLSKGEREDVELRLRDDPRPTTAVATTTLELGIDVGDVETVAQIGPGFSVSSLRQRLGRSGRRAGTPAVFRMFVVEPGLHAGVHPTERLRLDLVQGIAMVEAMLKGLCEPPDSAGLHLSTLVHQTLALLLQSGSLRPGVAYRVLCEAGPFQTVSRDMYALLLRSMASSEHQLIEMSSDGNLMLAAGGEALSAGHEFYAVFETPVDYRVLHGAHNLGALPMDHVVAEGQTIIFAGRRWRVMTVDDKARVILVQPTKAALLPTFGGNGGAIHDLVVEQMRLLLSGTNVPVYLNGTARLMLEDARAAFLELGLDRRGLIQVGRDVYVYPWAGSKRLGTLSVAFLAQKFVVAAGHHHLEIENCAPEAVDAALRALIVAPFHTAEELAALVAKPEMAKFDSFLSLELLNQVTIAERLDVPSLPYIAQRCFTPAAVTG